MRKVISLCLMALFVSGQSVYAADLILNGQTTTLFGHHTYDNVSLTNGAKIIVRDHDGSNFGTLKIEADTIFVDASSTIDASEAGFEAVQRQDGQGPGAGQTSNNGASGGSHGGLGGEGHAEDFSMCGATIAPLDTYNNAADNVPASMGSSGGSGDCCGPTHPLGSDLGGDGGGAVILAARHIDIQGKIVSGGGDANNVPQTGSGDAGGGGAGGGIYIYGDLSFSCTGTLSANGGVGATHDDGGGGGGGGVIKQAFGQSSGHTFCSTEVAGGDGNRCGLDGADGVSFTFISAFLPPGCELPPVGCDLSNPLADCDNDDVINLEDCAPEDPTRWDRDVCGVCGGDGTSCGCQLTDDDADCDNDGVDNGEDCAPEDPTRAFEDCLGVCGGAAQFDCAGVCEGPARRDCAGVCNGTAREDCFGVCGGSAERDCRGICGGTAMPDCLGVCNGSATVDCVGECNGTAEFDECGVCNGDGSTCGCQLSDDTADCDGDDTPNGDDCAPSDPTRATLDCLGVCGGNAAQDCNGVCQGTAMRDCLGVCNGGAQRDCAGVCNGTAVIDECGVCEGDGTTCECLVSNPVRDCDEDGVQNGDDCAPTDPSRSTFDCAGICGGTAQPDCEGVCQGIAIFDCAGVCGGNTSLDCNGVCGGSARLDCADVCGGTAVIDCAGICGGDAVLDECGICGGDGSSCAGCDLSNNTLDCDNDGLNNGDEASLGTDPQDPDSDDDGLQDGVETDGDATVTPGETDPLNPDTDDDGYCDGSLAVAGICQSGEDTNNNGVVEVGESDPLNPCDPDDSDPMCSAACSLADMMADCDLDGLSNGAENMLGTDPEDPDTDDDGLLDGVEDHNRDGVTSTDETDPLNPDTDGDGLCDGSAAPASGVCFGGEDLDDDGVIEAGESDPLDPCDPIATGASCTSTCDVNNNSADCDGDGLDNGTEDSLNTDPLDPDSDDDGILDGVEDANRDGVIGDDETDPTEPDTDGDGFCDGPLFVDFECDAGEDQNANGQVDVGESDPLDPCDPVSTAQDCSVICDLNNATADCDNDGLNNGLEAIYGTEPADPDTDNDGILDGIEDTNKNGQADATETDALNADTDGDGLCDGDRFVANLCERGEDLDRDGVVDPLESDPRDRCDPISTFPECTQVCDVSRLSEDCDSDGLSNGIEAEIGTHPLVPDSDGDGLPDGLENRDGDNVIDEDETDPTNPDTDGDGLCDGSGTVNGVCESGEDLNNNGVIDSGVGENAGESDPLDPCDPFTNAEGCEDPVEPPPEGCSVEDDDADCDGDGISNGVERERGTNPRNRDSDGDGLDDNVEDPNLNGVLDAGESNPLDPCDPDSSADVCDAGKNYLVIGGGCADCNQSNTFSFVLGLIPLAWMRRRRRP